MAVRSFKIGPPSRLLDRAGVLEALARQKAAKVARKVQLVPQPRVVAPEGTVYRFTVPGEPVTWKRAKRGPNGSYTDPKDAEHRRAIQVAARNAGIRLPIAGPVALSLGFYRANADDPTALCTGDLDNLEKAVKDALKGIAYLDDRQVVTGEKLKRIDRAEPRTEIVVASGWRAVGLPQAMPTLDDDLDALTVRPGKVDGEPA